MSGTAVADSEIICQTRIFIPTNTAPAVGDKLLRAVCCLSVHYQPIKKNKFGVSDSSRSGTAEAASLPFHFTLETASCPYAPTQMSRQSATVMRTAIYGRNAPESYAGPWPSSAPRSRTACRSIVRLQPME